MDFAYTEEQQELVGLVQQILGERVKHETLTALEAKVTGEGAPRFDRDLWQELAKANILGISLPEEFGGSGLGVLEQVLVLEQVGSTLAPVPVYPSIAVAAAAIAEHGTAEQKAAWLPGAVSGEKILTAALAERLVRDAAAPRLTTAERADGGWRLTGQKTGVPVATVADVILVPAATPDGVGIFLVDPAAAGVTVTPQQTTAKEIAGELVLDGVLVGDDALLGGAVDSAVAVWLRDRATLALCALQLGVCERAMREAAAYTTTRVQFKRPVGSFQAVGHRLADCYIDVEAIRLTTWQAAWQVGAGIDASEAVATAKFWASEAGHRVAHAVVHVHGGMGIAEEHFVHRYFVHAKQIEFSLGGANEQALRIGAGFAARPAGEYV
ncbi:acyl-CoA dehydrogenase family protein [Yinghuangia seranimata]|uniref:acyl-CoA dehydrogenase family protein n=1 Tax=Yinghuangia seranimata TaxID=408067 RepID=UPI00248C0939|nr:acyl-CoA dehydrogenase family protein [Yinghuangia seranimata]MDI2131799.1 acyl-CoA dehydrogenase family protein [Yinghuangia seranimata]